MATLLRDLPRQISSMRFSPLVYLMEIKTVDLQPGRQLSGWCCLCKYKDQISLPQFPVQSLVGLSALVIPAVVVETGRFLELASSQSAQKGKI